MFVGSMCFLIGCNRTKAVKSKPLFFKDVYFLIFFQRGFENLKLYVLLLHVDKGFCQSRWAKRAHVVQ